MPVLMLFVDGLGIGPDDPTVNPVRPDVCPALIQFIERHGQPVDATLGIPGIPQSATGQTAILTGINAAERMGRHVEGFPGPRLREIIEAENIFTKLLARGLSPTFANAYYAETLEAVLQMRTKSVTTVATLSALGRVRLQDQLHRNRAVNQDITRETLGPRGYTGPAIDPHDAGCHLTDLARDHDFTLFEYFQTDRAGHSGDRDRAIHVLQNFDRFLAAILGTSDDLLVLLVSDHGNIEDLSITHHTLNPVPFCVRGDGEAAMRARVASLTDITPAILEGFDSGSCGIAPAKTGLPDGSAL